MVDENEERSKVANRLSLPWREFVFFWAECIKNRKNVSCFHDGFDRGENTMPATPRRFSK